MIEQIDILIPCGISLAMVFSRMPKRAVIAFCFNVSLLIILADYLSLKGLVNDLAPYRAALWVEIVSIVILLAWARRMPLGSTDRRFTQIMAGLFFISTVNTAQFLIGFLENTPGWPHERYVFFSELIAIVHVTIMLGLSDVFRNAVHHGRVVAWRYADRF